MTNSKTQIGLIGCGNISDIYIKTLQSFDFLEISACAAQRLESAQKKAAQSGIPRACRVEEIIADPQIEIVLSLTPPAAHFPIAREALLAGKSVYTEKPLAVERAQGEELLRLAAERGLRIGSAPDTFLGAGMQTCRKAIDDGLIGVPLGMSAFFMGHGMEDWHPNPEYFYQPGGGPLFDLGPYYLASLVSLLGPLRSVSGLARISFPERVSRGGPKNGTRFPVNTPTHITSLLEFENGAGGSLTTSFDVWASQLPAIEIYGSEGSLSIPDLNNYGGQVKVWRMSEPGGWRDVPLVPGYLVDSRGIGLAEMVLAGRENRPHLASGEMALHVLDAMQSILESADAGRQVRLSSTCVRPEPLRPLSKA